MQQELHEALHGALGHGHGVDSKQISVANATLLPIFSSLPKNDNGRVGAPVTTTLLINWSISKLNRQLNPTTCLGDTDCWIK